MWLSDVFYNLLDISRRRYSRRGYGGCLMKHLSGKSSAAMPERWSDRMEWGREERITRKPFECASVHVSVSHSSHLPGKRRHTMENTYFCHCTPNLHWKWTILQPVDKYIHQQMIQTYRHHTRAPTKFWTCSESFERLWAC